MKNIASSVDDSMNNAIDFEISRKIPNTESPEFNEVLPESNVELERFYKRKHEKIDEVVDSKVNGLSKNNNVAVKKLTQNKDVNSVENIMNNEKTRQGTIRRKVRICCRGQYHKAHKWSRNLRKIRKLQGFC